MHQAEDTSTFSYCMTKIAIAYFLNHENQRVKMNS